MVNIPLEASMPFCKLALTLCVLVLVPPCLGQTRIIPHLTDWESDYRTWIILENLSNERVGFALRSFDMSGKELPSRLDSLDPNETQIWDQGFTGTEFTSHFLIGNDEYPSDSIRVTIAYGRQDETGTSAYFGETTTQATRWRLFSGNWNVAFDAIAAVNLGNETGSITIRQMGLDGSVIKEHVINEQVSPMEKVLYVIGGSGDSIFDPNASNIFEIEATQPISLIALQGDQQSTLLWTNTVSTFND